jgi:hypothetical protein
MEVGRSVADLARDVLLCAVVPRPNETTSRRGLDDRIAVRRGPLLSANRFGRLWLRSKA